MEIKKLVQTSLDKELLFLKCLVILALEHYNWGHCKVTLTIYANQVKC